MMTSPDHLEERRAALEMYLNTVLEQEVYREHGDVVSRQLKKEIQNLECKKTLNFYWMDFILLYREFDI